MANIICNVQGISQHEEFLELNCKVVTQDSYMVEITVDIPISVIGGPASSINAAMVAAVESRMLEHGIAVGPGERVLILGGAV